MLLFVNIVVILVHFIVFLFMFFLFLFLFFQFFIFCFLLVLFLLSVLSFVLYGRNLSYACVLNYFTLSLSPVPFIFPFLYSSCVLNHTAVCKKPCQHGGVCIDPVENKCKCSKEYRGATCDKRELNTDLLTFLDPRTTFDVLLNSPKLLSCFLFKQFGGILLFILVCCA